MKPFSRRTLLIGAAAAGAYATVRSPSVFAQAPAGPFKLDPLPYANNKNEPHIDAMTMEIHHDRHHAALHHQPEQRSQGQSDPGRKAVARVDR